MSNWRQFEKESFQYIKTKFENKNVKFELEGKSNSNTGDIAIIKNKNVISYIEVKSPISQAGQFVIEKNNKNKWSFSKTNRSLNTKHSDIIIKFINQNLNSIISTKGIDLNVNEKIQFNWIKDFYNQRNVTYFITEFNNQKIIIPLNKIHQYFHIKSTVRTKLSGSADVSNNYWNTIKNHAIFNNIEKTFKQNNKFYIRFKQIPKIIDNNIKNKFEYNNKQIRYQLQRIDPIDNIYYLRKLSTTSNPTVIFTLISKRNQNEVDLNNFIQYINT